MPVREGVQTAPEQSLEGLIGIFPPWGWLDQVAQGFSFSPGCHFQVTLMEPLSARHPAQFWPQAPGPAQRGDLLKVNPHKPTPLRLWSDKALKRQFCHQHLQQHGRCHDLFLTFKIATCGCYGYTASRWFRLNKAPCKARRHCSGLLTSSLVLLSRTHLAPPGGRGSWTPEPRPLLAMQSGHWGRAGLSPSRHLALDS